MRDAIKVLRQVLLADAGIVGLAVSVYGGILPEHYDPTSNPAIVITVKGGSAHSEIPLQNPSVQIQCWSGINEFVLAHQVDAAVFNALHGLTGDYGADGRILVCLQESIGRDMVDPQAGWVQVVSSYKLEIV